MISATSLVASMPETLPVPSLQAKLNPVPSMSCNSARHFLVRACARGHRREEESVRGKTVGVHTRGTLGVVRFFSHQR